MRRPRWKANGEIGEEGEQTSLYSSTVPIKRQYQSITCGRKQKKEFDDLKVMVEHMRKWWSYRKGGVSIIGNRGG